MNRTKLNKEEISKLYLKDGYTRKQIAGMLGVTRGTLDNFMFIHKIKYGADSEELESRINYGTPSKIRDSRTVKVEDLLKDYLNNLDYGTLNYFGLSRNVL